MAMLAKKIDIKNPARSLAKRVDRLQQNCKLVATECLSVDSHPGLTIVVGDERAVVVLAMRSDIEN